MPALRFLRFPQLMGARVLRRQFPLAPSSPSYCIDYRCTTACAAHIAGMLAAMSNIMGEVKEREQPSAAEAAPLQPPAAPRHPVAVPDGRAAFPSAVHRKQSKVRLLCLQCMAGREASSRQAAIPASNWGHPGQGCTAHWLHMRLLPLTCSLRWAGSSSSSLHETRGPLLLRRKPLAWALQARRWGRQQQQ